MPDTTEDRARRVAVELLGWSERKAFVVWSEVPKDYFARAVAMLALEKLAEEDRLRGVIWNGAAWFMRMRQPGRTYIDTGHGPDLVDAILVACCAVLDARGGDD